jgi:hypothetical protein
MNESNVPANTPQNWKRLVETAIFDTNSHDFSQRIKDAQDAIMDEIEDSFQTASQSERQSLVNAMNSVRELRRILQTPESESAPSARNTIDA